MGQGAPGSKAGAERGEGGPWLDRSDKVAIPMEFMLWFREDGQ